MTWLQDLETDDVCWMISRFAELLKCWLKVKTVRASNKDNKDSLWLFHLTKSSCVNLANSWLSPATIFTGPATYRSCEQGSWEANCWYPGLSKECTKHVQAHNMKHIDGAPHPPGAGASAGQTVGGHTWVQNRDLWKSGTAHASFSKGHPSKNRNIQNIRMHCSTARGCVSSKQHKVTWPKHAFKRNDVGPSRKMVGFLLVHFTPEMLHLSKEQISNLEVDSAAAKSSWFYFWSHIPILWILLAPFESIHFSQVVPSR